MYAVAMTKDNKYLASGGQDGSLKIFDVQNNEFYHDFCNAHTSTTIFWFNY